MASVRFSYLPDKQAKFFGALFQKQIDKYKLWILIPVNSQRPKTVYKARKLISTNVVSLINNKIIINPAHQELYLG